MNELWHASVGMVLKSDDHEKRNKTKHSAFDGALYHSCDGIMYGVKFSDELYHHGVKGQRLGVIREKVKEKAGQVKDTVKEKAGQVKSAVKEKAEQVKGSFSTEEKEQTPHSAFSDDKEIEDFSKMVLRDIFLKQVIYCDTVDDFRNFIDQGTLESKCASVLANAYPNATANDLNKFLTYVRKNTKLEREKIAQKYWKKETGTAPNEDTSPMSRMRHGALYHSCDGTMYGVKFR